MDQRSTATGPKRTEALSFLWPVAAALGAVWLAMLLVGGNEIDRGIIIDAHVSQPPWLPVVLFVTRLGDWEVLMALPFFAAGFLLLQRRRRLALLLLASVVAGRLLVEIQKGLLGRLRPEEHEHLVRVESFAFPSGHAANSMIVYLLLALILIESEGRRRFAVVAGVLLSLLIGASRVLLGVHWPTDVVGGWAFGLLWVLLTLHALRTFGLNER